ncbi:DNA helicase [Nostoc phage Nsp-JY18]
MLPVTLLRPVQRRVIDELKASVGVIAVLGMGGGKTVSSLTAIRELIDEGVIRKAIVTAPRRVALKTWPDEVKNWEHLHRTKLVVLSGGPAQRKKALLGPGEVYVIGIDNLQWLVEELAQLPDGHPLLDLLAIDEISRLKSPRGKRAKAILKQAERLGAIWGLTGTPRPNDEADHWMQLQVISAGTAFKEGFDEWRRARFMPMDHNGYRWRIHDFARRELDQLVDTWCFTVPPEDVVDVPFSSGDGFDTFFDLSEEAIRDLDTLNKKLLVELGLGEVDLRDPDEETLFALSKATATGKMAQILQGFLYNEQGVLQTYKNPREELLLDLLEESRNDPVLVPYWYKEDLGTLRRLLGDDVPYLGEGVSDKAAARTIDRWNAREIAALPIHPASAGHGLNLQSGGRRIVWYSMTWSPELYVQLVKRLARPGQKLPVFSHRIRAKHWLEDMRINRVEHKVQEELDAINRMRVV